MRLLICAGGTGGGVYPAVTALEALGIDQEDVLWVGSYGGMEEALVTRREIPFTSIPAAGVHGVGWRKLPGNLWTLFKGFLASRRILRSFQPDVLFFTGGYVAFPMAVAAVCRPSLLYVPDIEPGLALKTLARFSNRIALTTETSREYFPNRSKLAVTGYPVRPGLQNWIRQEALDYFGFNPNLPILAVAGGSKGARSINMALLDILPNLLDEMQVIHLTGHLDWEVVEARAKQPHGSSGTPLPGVSLPSRDWRSPGSRRSDCIQGWSLDAGRIPAVRTTGDPGALSARLAVPDG